MLWTLKDAAEVSFEEGITEERVSGERIRATLKRLEVRWKRAKRWMTSSDPEYQWKRGSRPVDQSRPYPPGVSVGLRGRDLVEQIRAATYALSWTEAGRPMRHVEKEAIKADLDPPIALAAYGKLARTREVAGEVPEQMWLSFVDGRPVRAITARFLSRSCQRLETMGKKALLLVWDNASGHTSKEVYAPGDR